LSVRIQYLLKADELIRIDIIVEFSERKSILKLVGIESFMKNHFIQDGFSEIVLCLYQPVLPDVIHIDPLVGIYERFIDCAEIYLAL